MGGNGARGLWRLEMAGREPTRAPSPSLKYISFETLIELSEEAPG